MTFGPGDNGHIAEHNLLRANLNAQGAIVANIPGTYAAKGSIVYNVLDYGADPNAANATATTAGIQAAVNAAIAGNGVVFVPSGNYIINAPITLSDVVEIYGADERSSVLMLDNGSNCNMIEIPHTVTGVVIRSLGLNGNIAHNTSGSGIAFLDDPGTTYRGSGRLTSVRVVGCADHGIFLGRYRSSGYLTTVISGGNGQYGIFMGENSQDALIVSPNLGTNILAGVWVNGSNNTIIGGGIYGGTNLIVSGPNTSKFLVTGTVLEAANQHALVLGVHSGDDVSTHQFIACSFGRIGLTNPAIYGLVQSTTVKRLVISGHVYKKSADTAPAYLFDVPATTVVNAAGLNIQSGAYATGVNVSGTAKFIGLPETSVVIPASQFNPAGSTTTTTHINGLFPVISMPAAANSSAATVLEVPSWWTTFRVVVHGSNVGAGSGNVRLRATYGFYTATNPLDATVTTSSSNVTLVAGATNVAQDSTVATPITNQAGKRFVLRVDRRNDGSDTLANAWAFESVSLEWIS